MAVALASMKLTNQRQNENSHISVRMLLIFFVSHDIVKAAKGDYGYSTETNANPPGVAAPGGSCLLRRAGPFGTKALTRKRYTIKTL